MVAWKQQQAVQFYVNGNAVWSLKHRGCLMIAFALFCLIDYNSAHQ